jgi:topoisomerase IA-like protein
MVFEEQHGGRASALEILNGQFTAYYSNGEQNVLLRDESDRAAPALGDTQDKRKRQP